MNKILIATIALATLGANVAYAGGRDDAERAAYAQTLRSETLAPAPVIEGRNAAVIAAPAQQTSQGLVGRGSK